MHTFNTTGQHHGTFEDLTFLANRQDADFRQDPHGEDDHP